MCFFIVQVQFQTPRTAKKATPTRFEEIREMDEKENWSERNTVVLKQDHDINIKYAQDLLMELIENLPIQNQKRYSLFYMLYK